jgi:uncharacterized protein YxjI
MNPLVNLNQFLVKEHTGIFKAANNYDIFDAKTGEKIMECREELGWLTKILRFTDYKTMTPFEIEIRTNAGEKILTVKRGVAFFVSTVEVFDGNDNLVGKFKQKFFSFGGKFEIQDAEGNFLCTLQGKWTSWEFKFIKEQVELAQVSKKWAGIAKELFTTADNYVIVIGNEVPQDSPLRLLILAAVMCVDMVLKE